MRVILCPLLLLLVVRPATAGDADYAIGADLSFLRQAEGQGVVFKDHGEARPGLQILKDHSYNWVRLRLFHTPTTLPNNLQYTLALARQAKALGFHFLLDLHYSDTWADPAHQTTPKAWRTKSHAELVQAVLAWTRDSIAAFEAAGVLPDMVQIGNEVTAGMLWPDGRLPDHWNQFADLLKAGIDGVHAGAAGGAMPRIMIHIDRGGDVEGTRYFVDRLVTYKVPFDVIGLSYYPWWHGGLADLRSNLASVASRYQKDIIVVEAAWNWKPAEYQKKSGPWPETPAGQRCFWEALNQAVQATPGHRGIGVFWWEPAVTGQLRSRGFFDDDGNALPVITVFDHASEPRPF
jgi:arabinogalactan endo-1,4-beta-galactosidase